MYPIGFHPQAAGVDDFDGDSHLDIAVTNEIDQSVSLLLGKGDGSFVLQISPSDKLMRTVSSFVSADLDHDYRAEITVAQNGSDQMSILAAYDLGSFT